MSEPVVTPTPEVIPPVVVNPTPVTAPEVVTLSKEDYDKMARDAARARSNQSDADRFRAISKGSPVNHFKPQPPVVPPTQEEIDGEARTQDRLAERGLLQLAVDPAYRDVFDADPTLRDMFFKAPLAVLPLLAPDAFNAEDAINLVKDALDAKKPKPVATASAAIVPPPTPNPGAIQANDTLQDDAYEAAKKLPNVETSLAGMIAAKLKRSK